MNGFNSPQNLVYLQVKGKNQLFKEIEETNNIEYKMYSPDALYKLTDLPLQDEDFENDEPSQEDKDTKSESGQGQT